MESWKANEEWRQRRRDEWSMYLDDVATLDLQEKIQKITGLDDEIINCEENTPVQQWIDNMTEKMLIRYVDYEKSNNIDTQKFIEEDLSGNNIILNQKKIQREKNCLEILASIGFNKQYLNWYVDVRGKTIDNINENDIIHHMTIDEMIETIINVAFMD
jgi:hypothetical protein